MNATPLTRSSLLAAGTVVLSGALVTGCKGGGGGVSDEGSDTRKFTVSEKVTDLSIEAPGGDMEVTGDSGSTIRVTQKITYTGEKPKTGREVSDGKLSLSAGPDCGPIDDSDCDVTYHVKVPRTLKSVKLVELGGDVRVKSLEGTVEARTTGGSVRASDLAGKSLKAKVSGGSITGSFTKVPDKVDLNTTGGKASMKVPGSATYAVDAKSTGGKRQVSVNTDPASKHTVKLRAVGGNVSLY